MTAPATVAPPPHTCHAIGCTVAVPRKLFMCLKHWRMVPRELQRAIWRTYSPGQEYGEAPVTPAYLDAARAAKEAVRAKEQPR